MIKHHVKARFLLSSALSLFWLSAATAQVTVPGPLDMRMDSGVDSSMILQTEQKPDRRQQLATPEGRQQAFERSMRDQRAYHPELARVLGVDTATVEQVLALLAESEVDAEIRAGRMQPRNLRTQAEEYDQQIQAISKLIGEARLDSYLEYQRTRRARIEVQQFNASLPESSRLSNAQKDRFATLLADLAEARLAERPLNPLIARRSATPAGSQSSQERWRELQRFQINRDERQARRMEADTRELLQRLPQILAPEQVRAYARREAREVEQMFEQARQQRSRAGFGPDEPLDVEAAPPPPTLTADTRLQLRVRINGVEIKQTLTSKSGGSVSFEGPEGLLMEARPRLYGSSQLAVTLQAYEPSAGAQRLIGRAETSPQITNPQQRLAYPGLGAINRDSLLRGRKAYVLNWDAKVTFL